MKPTWLIFVLLSGCFQSTTPEVAEVPVPPPNEVTWVEMDGLGCGVVVAFFGIDFEVATSYLPAGYLARDIADVFGSSVPAGQGALGVTSTTCPDSDRGRYAFGTASIVIEQPRISEDTTPKMDVYTMEWYVEDDAFGQGMAGAFQVTPTTITHTPGIFHDKNLQHQIAVAQDVFRLEASGFGPFTLETDGFRVWTEASNGTVLVDILLPERQKDPIMNNTLESVFQMGTAACEFADGTVMTEFDISCAGTGALVASDIATLDLDMIFLPNRYEGSA